MIRSRRPRPRRTARDWTADVCCYLLVWLLFALFTVAVHRPLRYAGWTAGAQPAPVPLY